MLLKRLLVFISIFGLLICSINIKDTWASDVLVDALNEGGSVASQQENDYHFTVPPGSQDLEVKLYNLSADADLYVKSGSRPTTGSFDCRPYLGPGVVETCSEGNPIAGEYYIVVRGYSSGTITYSIKASYTAPPSNDVPNNGGIVNDALGTETYTSTNAQNSAIVVDPIFRNILSYGGDPGSVEIDAHLILGPITEDDGGQPGYGNGLLFSGGDDWPSDNGESYRDFDSQNSDLLAIARYNSGLDQSELRIVIGDNPHNSAYADRLSIGPFDYTNQTNQDPYVPRMTVLSTGNVGIGTANPMSLLHMHQNDSEAINALTFTNYKTTDAVARGTVFGITPGGDAAIWNFENASLIIGTNNAESVNITNVGGTACVDVKGVVKAQGLELGGKKIYAWPQDLSSQYMALLGKVQALETKVNALEAANKAK